MSSRTRSPNLDFETATVSDVMRRELVTCAPDAPAVAVARMMASQRVHAVVLDGRRPGAAEGECAVWGVVSGLDLARAAGAGVGGLSAADLAATEPLTVAPSTPLGEAAQLMDEHGIAHLIVADGERPLGVVSTLDIARALAGGPAGGLAPRPATPDPGEVAAQAPAWSEHEACGGVHVVEVAGALVFPGSRVFAEHLAAIARGTHRSLVVDLSRVTRLDAALAGVLGAAARQLAWRGQRVAVVAAEGHVLATIANATRSSPVAIVPTVREALARVGAARTGPDAAPAQGSGRCAR